MQIKHNYCISVLKVSDELVTFSHVLCSQCRGRKQLQVGFLKRFGSCDFVQQRVTDRVAVKAVRQRESRLLTLWITQCG